MKNIELLKQGAFPEHFDPWLEKGRFFHQLHAQMIGNLLNEIQSRAIELGYIVGRETSIQISQSEPDLSFRRNRDLSPKPRDYAAAVLEISMETGIQFEPERALELDRLFIESSSTGRVVTVLEIISPSNKNDYEKILLYQKRRQGLLDKAIDVVEIDLTRSYKHLINDEIAQSHPYHIAIHLHDAVSHYLGIKLRERLKSFALPLEDKVIPVELDRVYRKSYSELMLAFQMLNQKHYSLDNLPFPSTISDSERSEIWAALEAWLKSIE